MKNKKIIFLYRGPHYIHLKFARSVKAKPYSNYLLYKFRPIPKILIPFSFLIRFLTLPQADIYLCEDGYSLILVYFKKLFNKNLKIILMVASPMFYKYQKTNHFFQRLMDKVFDKIFGAIAVSNFNKELAQKYLKCPIEVVYPFIEIRKYQYLPDFQSQNVLHLGSINRFKGVDIIIKASQKWQKKKPKSKLILCGPVTDESIRKISKNIEFSPGYIKNPRRYFRRCSIIVNAAEWDSFSVSILQAMASGLIPVITEFTGMKEILAKIDRNLVVKRNSESICQQIIRVLNLSDKSKLILSRKCREAAEKLDEKNQIKKFQEQFDNLVSRA